LQLTARQGDALHAYSLAARADGDLEAAVAHGRAALVKIEALRERVAHPELRAMSSATRQRYCEEQIDLLMTLHERTGNEESSYLREALAVSERSRGRMTMDLLGEADMDLARGMEPEVLAERRELYAALAGKRQLQERESSTEGARRLSSEMDEIENRLALLETEHRRANPAYVQVASPDALDATEIQAQLDPDTLLLQYSLGEERSFLWAVTAESIRGFVLPGRAAVEAVASAVHAELAQAPSVRASRNLGANLSKLSGYVLNGASSLLRDKPRLLIAADGALQYIPFGVLPLPRDSLTTDALNVPLIAGREDREIYAVASMSVRRAVRRASHRETTSNTVAVFADPVMEATDRRLSHLEVSAVSNAVDDDSVVTTRSSDGAALGRIPYTGREAQAIADLSGDAATLVAVGFDANLDAVLTRDLTSYRYIHFATHGIVDSEHPALSALALSQFDELGRRRPGYLRLHDIYTLKLDADLVVLSACDTALGREIRGEGFIGLTQGFLHAGARNLVASLWQVPDNATAELMRRFYERLLRDQRNPASALAEAQRSMAAERGRSDPYFWGAFVIQGG
jgi:hypothetical protein